jgi:hypothetical protein
MRYLTAIAVLALTAGCTAATADERAEMEANSEAKLAAALRGYEPAGPPVACVSQRDLGGNRAAGDDAIIFDGKTRGNLWVNRPAGGCAELQFGRALIIRTTGSQLCHGEIATVFDPVSRTEFAGCGLGDFEPYRRIARR